MTHAAHASHAAHGVGIPAHLLHAVRHGHEAHDAADEVPVCSAFSGEQVLCACCGERVFRSLRERSARLEICDAFPVKPVLENPTLQDLLGHGGVEGRLTQDLA
jgi:hypothetical protein